MSRPLMMLSVPLLCLLLSNLAHAQAPAGYEFAYGERMVTTYRPVQQHVIVPVRESFPRTPLLNFGGALPYYETKTRWEERWETNYVPSTQRQYVAEARPATKQEPFITYAQPPATQVVARPAPTTMVRTPNPVTNPSLATVRNVRPLNSTIGSLPPPNVAQLRSTEQERWSQAYSTTVRQPRTLAR